MEKDDDEGLLNIKGLSVKHTVVTMKTDSFVEAVSTHLWQPAVHAVHHPGLWRSTGRQKQRNGNGNPSFASTHRWVS